MLCLLAICSSLSGVLTRSITRAAHRSPALTGGKGSVVLTMVRLWCLAGGFGGSSNCLVPSVAYHITLELTKQPPFISHAPWGFMPDSSIFRPCWLSHAGFWVSGPTICPWTSTPRPGNMIPVRQPPDWSGMESSPDHTVLLDMKNPRGHLPPYRSFPSDSRSLSWVLHGSQKALMAVPGCRS